jgi:hypothetical protein
MFRVKTISFYGLIILCAIFQGCVDVKTLVPFNRSSIPTLGKVGIVCVYEPCGPTPGILNYMAGEGQLGVKLFREASPAEDLREKFAARIVDLTGPLVRIDENEPEVERIKGTRGLGKIDNYNVEKLNLQAVGDKYGVQTLIIIRSRDFVYVGDRIDFELMADARMVNVHTGKILWRKRVGDLGCFKYVGGGRFSAADIRREFAPLVDCVVDHLSRDFEPSP